MNVFRVFYKSTTLMLAFLLPTCSLCVTLKYNDEGEPKKWKFGEGKGSNQKIWKKKLANEIKIVGLTKWVKNRDG